MMTQTWAILVDAYRELHARKLFWIVLALNVLVMAAFGSIGVTDRSITFLWFEVLRDAPIPGMGLLMLYKQAYSNVVVGFFLTWAASILAIISTAGIFPDFLSSGSIDLFLAKPISRARLFVTKYFAGLLFVVLQVSVFTVLSFLVLGARAGLWEPGLFLAIPVVVLFFSYLYCVCVLLGVWTRSTIAALLLTLLAWFGFWALDTGENAIKAWRMEQQIEHARIEDRIDALDAQLTAFGDVSPEYESLRRDRQSQVERLAETEISPTLALSERLAYVVKTAVPKTRETIALLDRVLFSDSELLEAVSQGASGAQGGREGPAGGPGGGRGPRFWIQPDSPRVKALRAEHALESRERPIWWIVGTSLVFEAVVLSLAGWVFCRRDY